MGIPHDITAMVQVLKLPREKPLVGYQGFLLSDVLSKSDLEDGNIRTALVHRRKGEVGLRRGR